MATLIFDFLCVHPFRDGNGRVSRLLTLLALYQQGFEVGRYVSLEKLKGDRKGQHSIRINSQFRVCFRWKEGGIEDVEIVVYHP